MQCICGTKEYICEMCKEWFCPECEGSSYDDHFCMEHSRDAIEAFENGEDDDYSC